MFSKTVPKRFHREGHHHPHSHMMCKMTVLAFIGACPLGNPEFSHDTDIDLLEPSSSNSSVQCAF